MPEPTRSLGAILLIASALAAGCSGIGSTAGPRSEAEGSCEERQVMQLVVRRADAARLQQLHAEIERLTSDLAQAQEALVAAESKLKGAHTRAAAVRALAEARSQLEGAATEATWNHDAIGEAEALLAEGDERLRAGHNGAAILLASRAQRISSAIAAEAARVRSARGALRVSVVRANLRVGPSVEHDVVATLSSGTPVFPERTEGGWSLVRTASNEVGWIRLDLTEALPRAPASPGGR